MAGSSRAELMLSTSTSQVCTPLNVSWTPQTDGYPYTVWISGIRGAVDTYRINSDYQPNTDLVTFQYVVPPPTTGFTSYIVVVADNKGNGNTTRPIGVSLSSGSNANCDPFTAAPAWTWAGDPQNSGSNMEQCGIVRFYNIDNRGTAPFTITWVPIQGDPITVNVPKEATRNTSTFVYETVVPFAAGTQFQIVLGDAAGGASGGGSELYTAGSSSNSSCLSSGFMLPHRENTRSIPTATNVATFRNLAGAFNSTSGTGATESGQSNGNGSGSGGGSNVGAIAGGAIGGGIALVIFIGCVIAFLIYKKRQKAKKEEARKEGVHFVDLDGDEDESPGADALRRSRINRDGGVQQTYSVSPFTYQPTTTSNLHPGHEMTDRVSRNSSFQGSAADGSGTPVHDDAQYAAAAAAGMAQAPSSNHGASRPTSSHSFSSNNGLLSSPTFASPAAPFAFAEHHRTSSAGSMGAYRLRTTNDDASASRTDAYGAASSVAAGRAQAGALPSKSQLAGAEESAASAPTRRVVMHSDGGPLPQPESDDEEVPEELPPRYGGWTQPSSAAQS
ncbi:hypothetical protein ACQY0O_008364 [Thecaphora frezii]